MSESSEEIQREIKTEKYSNGCGQYLNECARRSSAQIVSYYQCVLTGAACLLGRREKSRQSVIQRDRTEQRKGENETLLKTGAATVKRLFYSITFIAKARSYFCVTRPRRAVCVILLRHSSEHFIFQASIRSGSYLKMCV